eukprot:1392480-Amorphochlora_amoeboformis.AAC.2
MSHLIHIVHIGAVLKHDFTQAVVSTGIVDESMEVILYARVRKPSSSVRLIPRFLNISLPNPSPSPPPTSLPPLLSPYTSELRYEIVVNDAFVRTSGGLIADYNK